VIGGQIDEETVTLEKLKLEDLIDVNNYLTSKIGAFLLGQDVINSYIEVALTTDSWKHTNKDASVCFDLDGVIFDVPQLKDPFDLDAYFTAPYNELIINEAKELSEDYEIMISSSRPPQAIGVTIDKLNEIEFPWESIAFGKVPTRLLVDDRAHFYDLKTAHLNRNKLREILE
jgi:hypothetical protein